MTRNPMQAGQTDQGARAVVSQTYPQPVSRAELARAVVDQGAGPDQGAPAAIPAEIAPRPDVDQDPRDLAGLRLFTYVLAGHGCARLTDDDLALALHASVYGLSRDLTGPAAERLAGARRLSSRPSWSSWSTRAGGMGRGPGGSNGAPCGSAGRPSW